MFFSKREPTKMLVDGKNLPKTVTVEAGKIFFKDVTLCASHFKENITTYPEHPGTLWIEDRFVKKVSPAENGCPCELCKSKHLDW